jgi:hypothetical protein
MVGYGRGGPPKVMKAPMATLTTTNRKGLFIMAINQSITGPAVLDLEFLNLTAAQLGDRADAITTVLDAMRAPFVTKVLNAIATDLKLASTIAERLAHLRFEIGEVITHTKDPDTARELRDALEDASKGA